VSCGVERESGKTFLVPDRTADTLIDVLTAWIEPSTDIISDSWAAYRNLEAHGYTHQTVNHSIGFVDLRTGAHTNTIESTWRHVKAFLNPFNRQADYIDSLAHYMFQAKCRELGVGQFTAFIKIAADTDWSDVAPFQQEPGAT
jgi:hypothetical protein